MSAYTDITGKKFARLQAIKLHHSEKRPHGGYRYFYLFECDCGNKRIIRKDIVISGQARSCGCLHKQWALSGNARKTHGFTHTKFYFTYKGMVARCRNKSRPDFYRYGGKGIKIEWKSFEEFRDDMYESFIEHVKIHGTNKTSIDRIDSRGNYSKQNCRWATPLIQGGNTSRVHFLEYNGKRRDISDWARIVGVKRRVIQWRIDHDWSSEKALITPVA